MKPEKITVTIRAGYSTIAEISEPAFVADVLRLVAESEASKSPAQRAQDELEAIKADFEQEKKVSLNHASRVVSLNNDNEALKKQLAELRARFDELTMNLGKLVPPQPDIKES